MLPRHALAEFQIQEASIEKGETEFEYRGAYHWGVPGVTVNNPNANDLVQSHELELQHSFTDWWLVQLTVELDQPLHEDFEASGVEFETEFALTLPCWFIQPTEPRHRSDPVLESRQGGGK